MQNVIFDTVPTVLFEIATVMFEKKLFSIQEMLNVSVQKKDVEFEFVRSGSMWIESHNLLVMKQ